MNTKLEKKRKKKKRRKRKKVLEKVIFYHYKLVHITVKDLGERLHAITSFGQIFNFDCNQTMVPRNKNPENLLFQNYVTVFKF